MQMTLDTLAYDDTKAIVNKYVNGGLGSVSWLTMGVACSMAAPKDVWARPIFEQAISILGS